MSQRWLHQQERSTLGTLRLIIWIALSIGRPVARALLHPIALYFVVFSNAARAASRDYLRRVLQQPVGWRQVYRHYHTFASTILDRVFLLSGRDAGYQITIRNEEVLEKLLREGRGCLLIGAHFGSFEALRELGRRHPEAQFRYVMYEDNAQKMNTALRALNPGAEDPLIALGRPEAMLRVQEALAAGAFIGLLADRLLGQYAGAAGGKTITLPFLGDQAQFPLGPFQLACALRCPAVMMFAVWRGDRCYEVLVEPLGDAATLARSEREATVRSWAERYAARLEALCRESPYNWFNFYDFWHHDDQQN